MSCSALVRSAPRIRNDKPPQVRRHAHFRVQRVQMLCMQSRTVSKNLLVRIWPINVSAWNGTCIYCIWLGCFTPSLSVILLASSDNIQVVKIISFSIWYTTHYSKSSEPSMNSSSIVLISSDFSQTSWIDSWRSNTNWWWASAKPVSYTHLDVYKRQILQSYVGLIPTRDGPNLGLIPTRDEFRL